MAALDDDTRNLAPEEVLRRIGTVRDRLGEDLVILGHHYQRDEVIRFADITGDSLKLSQFAASRSAARWVVFCGVHFMAESADILRSPHQRVILPNPAAGCSMADMAQLPQVRACWELLDAGLPGRTVPVVYVNSSAEVKAFAGERGGIACTSSNAAKVVEHALGLGERVLFLPDQHLGRYSGSRAGVPLERMPVWDPAAPPRGAGWDPFRTAALILWKGHCSVHQMFKNTHVTHFRNTEPDRRIIVHPECAWEVTAAADEAGSTEAILRRVSETAPGTRWAVGTELNMVRRLASRYPQGTVVPLTRFGSVCPTMWRIDPRCLLQALDRLAAGDPVNVVSVPAAIAGPARLALDRMLSLA
ncbi:MAG: quinolinate synthase NadA [Acidobacteria bacterium]|nr:quinolinate synthase NadA [Acidobacteriota bacterium]